MILMPPAGNSQVKSKTEVDAPFTLPSWKKGSLKTMKTKIITIKSFIILLCFLGLAGCSSNSTKTAPNKSEAANYNARLGAEYTRTGRLNLANEKLQKALAQNPRSGEAHHYYALLQQRLGENQKADQYFRRALILSPKDPHLLTNYGSHLCRNGDYQSATKHFLAALDDPLYTTPEFAYTNAGICIKKSGNIVQAESYFRKSLELKPTFGSALFQMAKLKYEEGSYSLAQAFIQRYHESNRRAPETVLLCERINTQLGDQSAINQCSANASAT
ncbi:type IV pilus biogenesis/stability protein PilW [Leucothrix sargassi]|nr:type IV pilus biogenesis/stability protein PilW [Leucothrix sargassi]